MPAQFTRMRSCPIDWRERANPASTSASEVTSTRQNRPPISSATALPGSALRSNSATLTPHAASRRAVAAPSPEAPPVTTAVIEASSRIAHSFVVRCILGRLAGAGPHLAGVKRWRAPCKPVLERSEGLFRFSGLNKGGVVG
jgi:hypothetical protein